MTKHTPGPWTLEIDPDGGFIVTTGPADTAGTWVIVSRNPIQHRADESHANGRLIATAPDLLGILRPLVDRHCYEHCGETMHTPRCKDAKKVIAKAEGK